METESSEATRAQLERMEVEMRARFDKIEARAEKLEALAYEERARQREQQVQIDSMAASRDRLHNTIGRWVERIVFGTITGIVWFWDKLIGN